MRYVFFFFYVIFTIFFSTSVNAAPKRVALVIGTDSEFRNKPEFGQAYDARMVGDAFRGNGFEVSYGLNTTKAKAEELISNFARKLAEKGVIAVFYFAGPAFNSGGENFIVPGDADRSSGEKLEKSFVSLKPIADALKGRNQSQRIILLDADPSGIRVWWKETTRPALGLRPFEAAADSMILDAGPLGGAIGCDGRGQFTDTLLDRLNLKDGEIGIVAADVKKLLDVGGIEILSPRLTDNRRGRLVLKATPTSVPGGKKPDLLRDFEEFKNEIKCLCGFRQKWKSVGEKILADFGGDELNRDVVRFVRQRLAERSSAEPRCRLEALYNTAFQNRDFKRFHAATDALLKLPIEEEVKLDISLTAAALSFDRPLWDEREEGSGPTSIDYARRALDLIDKQIDSKSRNWGIYLSYMSRDAARFWMHRIIGIRLLQTNPADALPHLWKAVTVFGPRTKSPHPCAKIDSNCTREQLRKSFYLDGKGQVSESEMASVYSKVGDYYFRDALSLSARYHDLSEGSENAGERAALAELSKTAADLSLDAFGRADVFLQRRVGERVSLPAVAGIFELLIPETEGGRFTAPSAETLSDRPIPVWKVLK